VIARWIFLVLLCLNLLLFIWEYYGAGRADVDAMAALPSGTPTIFLVSEVMDAGAPLPRSPGMTTVHGAVSGSLDNMAPPPKPTAPLGGGGASLGVAAHNGRAQIGEMGMRCARLGPFLEQSTAQKLIASLTGAGYRAGLDEAGSRPQDGYWVVLASQPDKLDRLATDLHAAGVRDFSRFRSGQWVDALSLGWYSDRVRAEKRLAQLSQKGFYGNIRPGRLGESSYWVSALLPENDLDINRMLKSTGGSYSVYPLPLKACHAIAAP
jgi:hypothetical protein